MCYRAGDFSGAFFRVAKIAESFEFAFTANIVSDSKQLVSATAARLQSLVILRPVNFSGRNVASSYDDRLVWYRARFPYARRSAQFITERLRDFANFCKRENCVFPLHEAFRLGFDSRTRCQGKNVISQGFRNIFATKFGDCGDSPSRCRRKRDRNTRARGRCQRALSITRLKQKAATRKPSSGSFRRSNGPLAQELPNDFLRVHWSVESQGYWQCAISAAAL